MQHCRTNSVILPLNEVKGQSDDAKIMSPNYLYVDKDILI